MLTIAIIEDEIDAAEVLQNYIGAYCNGAQIAYEVKIFGNAVDFFDAWKTNFDIIFLDIMLPDIDGLRAAHKIRERDSEVPIIFVTNMRQFAINGYEVSALDFIVKPVTYYGFEIAFRKALHNLLRNNSAHITIPLKGGDKYVQVSNIFYVEVSQHKLIYHTADEDIEAGGVLKNVEELLFPYGFRRCNHCYIVNMRYVKEVRDNSVIIGPNGDELQISRSKKKTFLNELSKYWGEGGRHGV